MKPTRMLDQYNITADISEIHKYNLENIPTEYLKI